MEVLDRDDQGPVLGQAADQRPDVAVHLGRIGQLGVGGRLVGVDQPAQVVLVGGVRVVGRVEQGGQDLDDRAEGPDLASVLERAADGDDGTHIAATVGERVEHAGLADAGFSRDQEHGRARRVVGIEGGERSVDRPELLGSADDHLAGDPAGHASHHPKPHRVGPGHVAHWVRYLRSRLSYLRDRCEVAGRPELGTIPMRRRRPLLMIGS